MIPEFPNFKPIELSDREDIETFTHSYPPYSDFNFVSIWSWNIKGEMRISKLNHNLVVRFTDYVTSKPFYTFLGNHEVNKTTEILLKFSLEGELEPTLKLIPEISIKEIDTNKFNIVESRDHFDYIYSTKELSTYAGTKFANKRNGVNKFIKKHPDIQLKKISIQDLDIQKQIDELEESWINNKLSENKVHQAENDLKALNRIFNIDKDLESIGLYKGNKLVAFCISELLPEQQSMFHFMKSDVNYDGVYEYLIQKNAQLLLEKGSSFINFEQDLGFENLRASKNSLRPTSFLKKYNVSLQK